MMPLSPLASWCLVAIVVGLPTLMLYCALVVGRRAEERAHRPLHRHTCSRCGRIQLWTEPFDQFSPCRACMIWKPVEIERVARPYDMHTHGHRVSGAPELEIDLDDFADADAIRVYLDGADLIRDAHA